MPWSVKAFTYGRGSFYLFELVGEGLVVQKTWCNSGYVSLLFIWFYYSKVCFQIPWQFKGYYHNWYRLLWKFFFSVTMLFWINFLYLIYITQFCSFLVPFKWIFNLATKITHLKIKQLNGIQLNANRPKFNQDFMNRP